MLSFTKLNGCEGEGSLFIGCKQLFAFSPEKADTEDPGCQSTLRSRKPTEPNKDMRDVLVESIAVSQTHAL